MQSSDVTAGILRLSHIAICVPNLEQAQRFYAEVFGFRRMSAVEVRGRNAEKLMQLKGVDLRAVYMERDGTRIELLHYRAPATIPQEVRALNQLGLTHLSFRVKDLESCMERVEAAGGARLTATRIDQAEVKCGFVLDPGGTRIELLELSTAPDWLPGMP